MTAVLFYLLAFVTAVCAVGVVVTQNIVRAAAWLLFTLAGTAGVYFLLGADFVGATQLFVYVGGTLVLVVFGVMLTAQGPFISMRIGAAEWLIAAAVGLLLFGVLAVGLSRFDARPDEPHGEALAKDGKQSVPEPGFVARRPPPAELQPSIVLGQTFLGIPAAAPREVTGVHGLHRVRTPMSYLLPFEIVSVHLLVVLIGAAYLARAKRRRGAAS
jgi:NADH-quinone oxidoreductase subunit J